MIRVPENIRRDVLQVCKRLYERGLVAGSDGNVSVRISKEHLLATPTGMSKGLLEADDLVVCDLDGKQLSGKRRLTTEIKIHLAVYAERQDVCAVVHAHPPHATAFAVAGQTLDEKVMPEAYIAVGKVALAPYGTPSTDELVEKLRPSLHGHDSVLLANHGAMTLGSDVVAAYHRMEALEQLARISWITRLLGGARQLSADEMAKLDAIRHVYGAPQANVPCYQCGWSPANTTSRGTVSADAHGDATPAGAERRYRVESSVEERARVRHGVLPRPAAYVAPEVHWAGNPAVWLRPAGAATIGEAQVRDLTRRVLHEAKSEQRARD